MNLSIVTSGLIERMGWTLVHTVWQAALAAALLALALYVGRRWRATLRYALSCIALLAIVFAAIVTFVRLAPPPRITPMPPLRVESVPLVDAPLLSRPAINSNDVAPSILPPRAMSRSDLILTISVIAWCVGVIAIGVTHAFGWSWLQRCRRRATLASDVWQARLATLRTRLNLSRHVALFITDRIDVPIVLGVVRPIILAPLAMLNDLPPSQIEAILAHELAHIRRNDYLVNLIQTAIETLLFYHPAVWWIARRIRIERECCCDAIAAELCDDRTSYVEALSAVALARTSLFQLSASFAPKRQSDLLERARRVLDVRPKREQVTARPWIVLPLLALLMLTSSSSSRVQSPTAQPTTQPTTKPAKNAIRIVAGSRHIYLNGSPSNWTHVRRVAGEIPADKRADVVVEVAAMSSVISAPRMAEVEQLAREIAKDAQLAGVSNIGIEPHPGQLRGAQSGTVQFIGELKRKGMLSVSEMHPMPVTMALTSMDEDLPPERYVTVMRSDPSSGSVSFPLKNVTWGDLLEHHDRDVGLMNGDRVIVSKEPASPQPPLPPSANRWRLEYVRNGMRLNDSPIDVKELRSRIEARSADERRKIVVEFAMGRDCENDDRFFETKREVEKLAREIGVGFGTTRFSNPGLDVPQGDTYTLGGDLAPSLSYALRKATTLRDALAEAGLYQGSGFVSVFRGSTGEEKRLVENVPLEKVPDDANNLTLQADDRVLVMAEPYVAPPRPTKYIVSFRPGRRDYQQTEFEAFNGAGEPITIREALARLENVPPDSFVQFMRDATKTRSNIPVRDIMNGSAENFTLEPRDMIEITDAEWDNTVWPGRKIAPRPRDEPDAERRPRLDGVGSIDGHTYLLYTQHDQVRVKIGDEKVTLRDALARVDGGAPTAGFVNVLRKGAQPRGQIVVNAPIKDMPDGVSQMRIYGGDAILVTDQPIEERAPQEFHIQGRVKLAGAFTLLPQSATLKQAVERAKLDAAPESLFVRLVRYEHGTLKAQIVLNDVPLGDVMSGKIEDPKLQDGDQITLRLTKSPATQPRADAGTDRVIPVLITERRMAVDDDFTSWIELKKRVDAMSREERARTTFDVRVTSDVDPIVVPELMRFRLAEARKAGLENVRDAGVATDAPSWLTDSGTYVVAGDLSRAGIYSLTGEQQITVKMAAIATGSSDKAKFINLIRRERGRPARSILKDVLVGDLWDGKVRDRSLHNDDLLVISDRPNPPQANVAPPPVSDVTHLKLQFNAGALLLAKEKIDSATLRERLIAIPERDRAQTLIELSPAVHDPSAADEYNAIKVRLEQLAGELNIPFAAVHVWTKDQPLPTGNVYSVSGDLVPYLTYPLTGRVTVRDAIARVERLQDGGYVTLLHGGGNQPPRMFENIPIATMPDDIAATALKAGDGLMLHLVPLPPRQET